MFHAKLDKFGMKHLSEIFAIPYSSFKAYYSSLFELGKLAGSDWLFHSLPHLILYINRSYVFKVTLVWDLAFLFKLSSRRLLIVYGGC